jgi:hypothetical protein
MSFVCNECNIQFSSKYRLKTHCNNINIHNKLRSTETVSHSVSPISRKTYGCICGKLYLYKQGLYEHKRNNKTHHHKSQPNNNNNNNDHSDNQRKLEKEEKDEFLKQITQKMGDGIYIGGTYINGTYISGPTCVNAFGQENIDYITNNMIFQSNEQVYDSIPYIISIIHFNKDHPENHNISIPNKKLSTAYIIVDQNKRQLVDKNIALLQMMNNGYNILYDYYIENKSEFSSTKQKNIEKFIERYNNGDKYIMKRIIRKIELLVLSGTRCQLI